MSDNEIRVLFGYPRTTDAVTLESTALDQTRRVIAIRIAEDAAGIRQVERLRGNAFG